MPVEAEEIVKNTIEICKRNGILADYLEKRESEVTSILLKMLEEENNEFQISERRKLQ